LIIASPFQELVTDLAGARALQLAPRFVWNDRFGGLHVDAHAGSSLQELEYRRDGILPERGIEENHVEAFSCALEISVRVIENELHLPRGEELARLAQKRECGTVVLDHYNTRGAARSCFEAERAATREKIEARESVERLPEPIE
jgi:hypothetical protein